jgi:hypothetical protein
MKMKSPLDRDIDHLQEEVVGSLSPEGVVAVAKQVFDGRGEAWLSIPFVYNEINAHPERYGIQKEQLPLLNDFSAICRSGAFDIDRVGDQILIRPRKESQR